jgi:hypothetical protein
MGNELITIQHCTSLPDAYLLKQALESKGIEIGILNENLHGLGQAGQSIELKVAMVDA